jgi:Zn-dependent alcohol dehydrogenase
VKIRAVVARAVDHLTIEDVDLETPHPGEVLVRVHAAGVCHSDLHTYKGELRTTPPVVLGHEGAGMESRVSGPATG